MNGGGSEAGNEAKSGSFARVLAYEEYLAANWLWLRRRWLWGRLLRSFLTVWFAYILIFAVISGLNDRHLPTAPDLASAARIATLAAFAVLVLIPLSLLWRIPRLARKLYAQMRLEGMETRYSFDADSFNGADSHRTVHYAWTDFVRWIENDRLLLIFPTDANFIVIPKPHIAPETLDALRAALMAANVPTR